jgi:hypothetical protein
MGGPALCDTSERGKDMNAPARKSTQLPRQFRRIRLELAREPGHPAGSSRDGYELIAPLDHDDRIDAALWRAHREACGVTRFRAQDDDEIGHLVHKQGGTWAFHYDVSGDDEDETGYRFQNERFLVGEYLSVREGDKQHTYRVVSVEHL